MQFDPETRLPIPRLFVKLDGSGNFVRMSAIVAVTPYKSQSNMSAVFVDGIEGPLIVADSPTAIIKLLESAS